MTVEMLLIVANSGRMLAQAGKNAGLKPLVIDLFADLDTQDYAEDFCLVRSLAEQDLAPAVDYFIERYAVSHVVYGSGFEYHPESLYYLNSRLTILGNHPDVFARLLDKRTFFSTLDQLNISYPEIAFDAPDDTDGWLIKPMQGQGGVGIKRYHAGDCGKTSIYWQKFQAGTQHSVLFLADGRQVQVIGFNWQWSVCLSETQAFFFSGVINGCDLPDAHKAEIIHRLKKMIPVFSLKGLNALDFIFAGDQSYVLEINPRPSASMQLYDADLLVRHIQACLGGAFTGYTPAAGLLKSGNTGYQIIYAERELIVPDRVKWPNWCADLPQSGNMYRLGQPLCSIIARHKNSRSVAEQLQAKKQIIISRLERF